MKEILQEINQANKNRKIILKMNSDEINQFLGLTSPFAQDPVALYRQHANRLKRVGL